MTACEKVFEGLYAALKNEVCPIIKWLFSYDFSNLSHHCGEICYSSLQCCFCFCTDLLRSLKISCRLTLNGPLQHVDSFLFQTFCCRFAAVLRITVPLHDPVLANL